MEIRRKKNVASIIVFPIVDADGDTVTGATALDSEIDAWTDGAAPDGFTDCTNEATEIGTTGIYYLSLTQTEMNNDYIVVQVKTTSSGAKTQIILINTTNQQADVAAWLGTAAATPTVAGVPEVDLTHVAGATTNVAALATNVDAILTDTADMQPKLGTPAGASMSADIAAIEAQTDDIGVAGAGLTAIPGVVTVTGNVNGSVGSIATGGIAAASFAAGAVDAAAIAADAIGASEIAANAIGASELAADAATEIADAILARNIAGGSSTGRTVTQALEILRNKRTIAAGTLTVYQTDDSTSSWTAAVTTAAGNPIDSIDPA